MTKNVKKNEIQEVLRAARRERKAGRIGIGLARFVIEHAHLYSDADNQLQRMAHDVLAALEGK